MTYLLLSPFLKGERKEENARNEARDTGSLSKSCTQIEFHEMHSALWRITAKIEFYVQRLI